MIEWSLLIVATPSRDDVSDNVSLNPDHVSANQDNVSVNRAIVF